MLAQIRKARQQESGFTLIELLIVIVILGVLAGIVVFAVSGITDTGEVAACKAEVKTVQVASSAYYAQSNPRDWADNVGELVTAGFLQDTPAAYVSYDAATGNVTPGATAPAGC